jgi:hypothetical protein
VGHALALGLHALSPSSNASQAEYLQGIDNAEVIATVHARKAPMIPASTGLRIQYDRRNRRVAGAPQPLLANRRDTSVVPTQVFSQPLWPAT